MAAPKLIRIPGVKERVRSNGLSEVSPSAFDALEALVGIVIDEACHETKKDTDPLLYRVHGHRVRVYPSDFDALFICNRKSFFARINKD